MGRKFLLFLLIVFVLAGLIAPCAGATDLGGRAVPQTQFFFGKSGMDQGYAWIQKGNQFYPTSGNWIFLYVYRATRYVVVPK